MVSGLPVRFLVPGELALPFSSAAILNLHPSFQFPHATPADLPLLFHQTVRKEREGNSRREAYRQISEKNGGVGADQLAKPLPPDWNEKNEMNKCSKDLTNGAEARNAKNFENCPLDIKFGLSN